MSLASTPPAVRLDGRYSIGETCEHLGIHRHTLRKYTDLGVIKSRMRKDGQKRFYLGREILKFWNTNT